MSLYGMQWRLRVSPAPALLNEKFVPLPQVFLAMGCLLATPLLAVTLRLAQTARLRTRQVECANQGLQNEIAERKQVEAELKTLNITLEQRVAERTAAVEARSQALAHSNTDLEQFAYVASHDLQEPLRMITGYLQLLERRYKEQLGPDADTFIAYAVDGATRMQRLIQDLLVYSRVEIQGQSFAPTHCEEILERVRTNLHVAIAESGAVITHTSLPVVMADDGQLTQLFQNLLSNALRFCEAKSPRIHAPRPALILLDLSLPKKNGREILAEIKNDPPLRRIPVVVLTTSEAEDDVVEIYNLHANCYITKPMDLGHFVMDLGHFVKVVQHIEAFWFTIVKLPSG